MTTDWDASTYHRVSGPQAEWAEKVLARLPLEGHETVLDAGCGSGRVTELLLERLPQGHVVAVDAAPSMVEHAREALGERATVLCQDLAELKLDEPVDAAFSNAVFHLVPDHQSLFASLFAALRPGARLVAQCGGEGNVERFHVIAREVGEEEPYAEYLSGWKGPWNFVDDVELPEEALRLVALVRWALQRPGVQPEPCPLVVVQAGDGIDQLVLDLSQRLAAPDDSVVYLSEHEECRLLRHRALAYTADRGPVLSALWMTRGSGWPQFAGSLVGITFAWR